MAALPRRFLSSQAAAPILYHYFPTPLPYAATLSLQHRIHELQLARRHAQTDYPDIMLVLQHRPVYTAGRRQKEEDLLPESLRLRQLGADYVHTDRGGQTTYHGPGQIVVYPFFDLGRMQLSVRVYVCRLEKLMQAYIAKYGLKSYPSEHTGLFLTPDVKLGSIGVQVRHRLTSHGIALNITNEPIPWFDQVVACGLDEVRAGSVSQATRLDLQIEPEARGLIAEFGVGFKRDVQSLDKGDPELLDLVTRLHEEALKAGTWPNAPRGHI